MPRREFPATPQLTAFLDGHAGPPAVDYRGGKVKVIAALVYADGIAFEWFAGPVPDLSWLPDVEETSGEQSTGFFDQLRDQPEQIERMRRFKRLSDFWASATLSDDLGTQYRWVGGDAGGAEDVGYRVAKYSARVHRRTLGSSLSA